MLDRLRELRCTGDDGGGARAAGGLAMALEAGGSARFGPPPPRAELETRGATFVSLPRAVFDELHGLAAARATGDLGSEGANLFDELIGHVARRVAAGQSPIPRRIAAAA